MGFEKFGQISFTAQSKVGGIFVDYLEKGELRGTKCRQCGEIYFPPSASCIKCLCEDMEWVKIEGTGKLVSFTEVNYGPTGFENDVPYILGLVDFDGVGVFGRFSKDVSVEKLAVGSSVKAETVAFPSGQVSYQFLPA